MQLLYVDDDRINLLLFEAACLALPGVCLATAGDGTEALACARGQRPDVLVIDLNLPDTDGFTLLAALRAEPGLGSVPAFLCTADDDPGLVLRAQAAGFRGCWVKPVDRALIAAALETLARPGAA